MDSKKSSVNLVQNTVLFMFFKDLLRDPNYAYLLDDRGLADASFDAYCDKVKAPSDRKELIDAGVYCLNAGLATSFSQSNFGRPVDEFSDPQVKALINVFQTNDVVEDNKTFLKKLGWGPYDTIEKKSNIFHEIAECAADTFIEENNEDTYEREVSSKYGYFMFNIGNTLAMNGNIVKSKE